MVNPVYGVHCPFCGDKLRVRREGPHFVVRCYECRIRYVCPPRTKDELDAYFSFIEAYERGEIRPKMDSSLVRSLDDIMKEIEREGISFDDLPLSVRKIIKEGRDYLVRYKLFREEEPEFGCSVDDLNISDELKNVLKKRGIKRLYKYQEEAIKAIIEGENVVIVAPTGMGKFEAFAIPIIDRISKNVPRWGVLAPERAPSRHVRAIFIYPTKALARDQLDRLHELCGAVGIRAEAFDGDTPPEVRRRIFSSPPDILVTNPDMLHYHMRKKDPSFRHLISRVETVVLDDFHVYTGAFGANVHFILQRLKRLCGGRLQFIGASATISNAKEFAETLFGVPVREIVCKKARRGRMHFLMLYPAYRSVYAMIIGALRALVDEKRKTLVFGNTHKDAEVINIMAKRAGIKSAVHRAGLRKEVREAVERGFKRGDLDVLVATPTLELGIDIGFVDATISMITDITKLTQRIGRAGRRGQESIAILALRDRDPISTYYRQHPDDYFTDIAPIYVEPHNEVVAYYQILAAAMDMPLREDEFANFENVKMKLLDDGVLVRTRNGTLVPNWRIAKKILAEYNIRGTGDIVVIYDESGRYLGEREMPMAARELHPGAIYLHGGHQYESISFEFRGGVGRAIVRKLPEFNNLKTEALHYSIPEVLDIYDRKSVFGVAVIYCKLRVTDVVHGYVVKNIFTGETVDQKDLDKEIKYTYETKGFVFQAPFPEKSIEDAVERFGASEVSQLDLIAGTFHAVEHVLIESSNMLTGGGSREIGGISLGTTGIIFVHDACPGGNGLSKLLYDRLEEGFRRSLMILKECKCKSISGCPNCTYSYQCGNNNQPLFKNGAIEVLEKIIRGVKSKIDEKEIPAEEAYV